jgi:hypothetical protein
MGKAKLKAVELPKLKLDLGCGKNKRADFHGVDAFKFDGVDTVHDLRQKWPWADGSVLEVHCSHFLEHLTGQERVHFFNELYRVMVPEGKATIVVPHWSSERAYGDPTHQWPPVVFFSFYYLNREWRAGNAPHTGYDCNFEATGGNSIAPQWQARNQEMQMFAQTNYINVAQDLIVTVTKR